MSYQARYIRKRWESARKKKRIFREFVVQKSRFSAIALPKNAGEPPALAVGSTSIAFPDKNKEQGQINILALNNR